MTLMFPEHESAFDAYKTYTAVKQHFTSDSYDIFKYHGKVRASESSFMKRRDKPMFFRLSRLDDIPNRVVATIIASRNPDKVWVADVVSSEGLRAYDAWVVRTSDIEALLVRDLAHFADNPADNLKSSTPLIRLMTTETVSIESVALFIAATGRLSTLDSALQDNLRWPAYRKLITKYLPFIPVDRKLIARAIKSRWPT